ncbi:MAG: exopolysaccharide biosynthesis polyprenyl glycosylphosphotransferase [Cytophagales bacterium]|nr:exopolysaccharide biosynthesis polyprenyl glycosylphosphotransferase [Cytophagales bacterium]
MVFHSGSQGRSHRFGKFVLPDVVYTKDTESYKQTRYFLTTLELLLVCSVFAVALTLYNLRQEYVKTTCLLLALMFCFAWWAVSLVPVGSCLKFEHLVRYKVSSGLWQPLLLHVLIVSLALSLFRLPLKYFYFVVHGYIGTALAIVILRNLCRRLLRYHSKPDLVCGKFVFVNSGDYGRHFLEKLTESWGRDAFTGVFESFARQNDFAEEEFDLFKKHCLDYGVRYVFMGVPIEQQRCIEAVARFASQSFIHCLVLPTPGLAIPDKGKIRFIGGMPVYEQWVHPLRTNLNSLIKRAFDIVFSFLVILSVLSWLVPVIALAVKLSSPGPVFFSQPRPGRRNKTFRCLKFRTMRVNTQTERQATQDDPRVTKVGRFLRKTSLDELPQFFNVLLGDMSVVGPRPNMVSQLEHYSELIPEYPVRHNVLPGITGYAQVKGYRGETKHLHLMRKRVDYDIVYIKRWSLWLDIKIILMTVRNIVAGEKHAY